MPRSVLSSLYERTRKSAVQIDDVLDAMVLYLLGLSKPEPLLSESVIDACGLAVNYQMPASRRGASL